MKTEYILSQVFVILNYLLVGITYVVKSRKQILIFNYTATVANAIHFSFLSAWSGLAVCGIAILRNIILSIQDHFEKLKNSKVVDWSIFAFLCILFAVSGYFTYVGVLSLFSIFASFIYTVSIWQKNQTAYKILGIACSACLITYLIFIWSLFGFICEIILLIVEIIVVIIAIRNIVKSKRDLKKIER